MMRESSMGPMTSALVICLSRGRVLERSSEDAGLQASRGLGHRA